MLKKGGSCQEREVERNRAYWNLSSLPFLHFHWPTFWSGYERQGPGWLEGKVGRGLSLWNPPTYDFLFNSSSSLLAVPFPRPKGSCFNESVSQQGLHVKGYPWRPKPKGMSYHGQSRHPRVWDILPVLRALGICLPLSTGQETEALQFSSPLG